MTFRRGCLAVWPTTHFWNFNPERTSYRILHYRKSYLKAKLIRKSDLAKNVATNRAQPEVKDVPVAALLLDADNPRFYHLKALHGKSGLSQDELLGEIEKDDEIPTLVKAIKKAGVTDPIWVKELDNGKYLVLEGNRRTYILKELLRESIPSPPTVRYDRVRAHVYPSDAPETELIIQKARLQTGKRAWGPFNVAAYIYELRFTHHMEEEDIAVELMKSIAEVKHAIEGFKLFKQYSKTTGDTNPKRFSMFDEAPKRVWDWINESDRNIKNYFKLISPVGGTAKIRSVATRGGLRDFAKILDDHRALDELTAKPNVTVEDALEIAANSSIKIGMPFLSRIGPLANHLQGLTEEEITMLKTDKKVRIDLKRLEKACSDVLRNIGVGKS